MPTRIRELRLERGYSQKTLARMAGISPGTIRNIETGIFHPSLLTLECLSKALDVPIEQLIAQETDPEADTARVRRNRDILHIRELRKERKWSRDALSAKAGIAIGTLKRLETGQSFPGSATLKKLAAAFDLTVSELYASSSAEPPPSET